MLGANTVRIFNFRKQFHYKQRTIKIGNKYERSFYNCRRTSFIMYKRKVLVDLKIKCQYFRITTFIKVLVSFSYNTKHRKI